jgi:hypothetical protein
VYEIHLEDQHNLWLQDHREGLDQEGLELQLDLQVGLHQEGLHLQILRLVIKKFLLKQNKFQIGGMTLPCALASASTRGMALGPLACRASLAVRRAIKLPPLGGRMVAAVTPCRN